MTTVLIPSLNFDVGYFETPWDSCLKDSRWVIFDRHLLHLLDIRLAVSAQRVLRNIAVIKITDIDNPKATISTCWVLRRPYEPLLVNRPSKSLELIEAFFERWEVS